MLPAGVLKVEGVFASLQAVRVVARIRKGDSDGRRRSCTQLLDGQRSATSEVATTPSIHTEPVSPSTTPTTPNIYPAASLSSSIISLDPPLSQSSSTSPSRLSEAMLTSSLAGVDLASRPKLESRETGRSIETITPNDSQTDDNEWEYVEIGKGQAHYNSSEIDRVKGLKTCVLPLSLFFHTCPFALDPDTVEN